MSTSKSVLLLSGDPRERQTLLKTLCATGVDVRFADPAGEIDPAKLPRNCKLIIIDYDSIPADAGVLLAEVGSLTRPPAVLVVTATRDKRDLIELLSHEVLTNLIAKSGALDATELVITVQKIIHNDLFGFEKYLAWGVRPVEHVVRSSTEKGDILTAVESYLLSNGCNKRLAALARDVGDEFLMNAVYNAPVAGGGAAKYAFRSRAERVDLERGEEVLFRYVYDGRLLALSVADNFGRLERHRVLNYLRKCFMQGADQIDQKDGGAGLGLYYIFQSLNQFVINVAPGRRTEMIGLMDVAGSFRDFARRSKSLNIFIEEDRP